MFFCLYVCCTPPWCISDGYITRTSRTYNYGKLVLVVHKHSTLRPRSCKLKYYFILVQVQLTGDQEWGAGTLSRQTFRVEDGASTPPPTFCTKLKYISAEPAEPVQESVPLEAPFLGEGELTIECVTLQSC